MRDADFFLAPVILGFFENNEWFLWKSCTFAL